MIKVSKAGKPNIDTTADKYLPVLLSFGPLFMCIGLSNMATVHGTMYLFDVFFTDVFFTFAGASSLSWGLGLLRMRQNRIVQRIAELEALKSL